MHNFFQSAGQSIYEGISAIGDWLSRLWNIIADWFMSLPAPALMKMFGNDKFNKVLFFGIVIYLFIMNIWAFCLFGKDKKHAKKKSERVKEKKLFRVCFFGGAAGGVIGMNVFSHKTKKKKFSVGIPTLFVLQLVLYSFILGFLGFWTFL